MSPATGWPSLIRRSPPPEATATRLAELGLLADPQRGMPNYQYFVTDVRYAFKPLASFLGRSIRQLEMVKLA